MLLIAGCSVLLAACSAQDIVVLPPEQVMERAADQVHSLSSATFHATASIEHLLPGAGTVGITSDGVMQDGGRQLAFTVNAVMEDPNGKQDSSVEAELIVAGDDETFVKLHTLKGDIPAAFFGNGVPPLDVWWQFPSQQGSAPGSSLTPDPSLMRAQAQVVNIERDRGIAEVGGHSVYQYDTVVDIAKLRAYLQEVAEARGEAFDAKAFEQSWARLSIRGVLEIDAKTFFVRKIDWTFVPVDEGKGLRGTISMTLSDHNTAAPVVPPTDAQPFPWGTLPVVIPQ